MWLNPPGQCLRSRPEPECSDTASASPSKPSASEPMLSAVVSGKVVPRPRSWRGWKSRRAAARLFGTMREPSHPDGGAAELEAWLTSSQQATHASPSLPPADVLAERMLATFGRRAVALLRASNRPSCFSKTSRATCLWGRGKSFGIVRDSATALRRACIARRKWARRIFASGCLSWASANAMDGSQREYQMSGKNRCECLPGHARSWATPRASASENRTTQNAPSHGNDHGMTTAGQAAAWGPQMGPSCGVTGQESTASAVQSFPPAEALTPGGLPHDWRKQMAKLPAEKRSWMLLAYRNECSAIGRLLLPAWDPPTCPRLNPGFQWWLMGWPHPATFFGWAETASIPCAPPGRSSTSARASWTTWRDRIRLALCSMVRAVGGEITTDNPLDPPPAASV